MKKQSTSIKQTGGQILVRSLREEGVKHVFGLIGSSTMEVFDALYDEDKIEYIGVRDERTGTHMTDAYSRVNKNTGVMIAGQSGPGATNLVTGLAQAYHANSPIVVIAGSISTDHKYRDAFQEVDQQALFTPVTKKTWTVDRVDRIPEMVQEAFRVCHSGKKGPVLLNIPRDILSATSENINYQSKESYRVESRPGAEQSQLINAVKLLKKSKKPLLIAGAGVKWSNSQEEVIALAEILRAPVATSAGHGDAIPSDHYLYAGQTGPRGNEVATNLAKEADVILVLGSRLGFNSTFYSYENLNPHAEIIQVNIEHRSLARYFPVSLGIVGDVKTVTKQLLKEIDVEPHSNLTSKWLADFIENRKNLLDKREKEGTYELSSVIQPMQIFQTIRKTMPKDTMYTLDAGTLCLKATDVLDYYQPPSLFTPLDFGLVGFSFAAGLGLKISAKDRTVVSLMGDGGFGMTVSELSTAVEYNLNTLTIVMNNHSWGAEKAYQRDFFGERYLGADITNPRYDRLAELYGAKGFYVDDPENLEEVFKQALTSIQNGYTTIVDVQVDPDALYSFRRDSFKHRDNK